MKCKEVKKFDEMQWGKNFDANEVKSLMNESENVLWNEGKNLFGFFAMVNIWVNI